MTPTKIAIEVTDLVNKQYEYIGNDINPSNGNYIFIFKDGDKEFAVEVYERVK